MEILEALKNEYKIITEDIKIAADGGTVSFSILDCENIKHCLHLDNRIDSKTTEQFYADFYPGSENSIYVGDCIQLKNELLTLIRNIE